MNRRIDYLMIALVIVATAFAMWIISELTRPSVVIQEATPVVVTVTPAPIAAPDTPTAIVAPKASPKATRGVPFATVLPSATATVTPEPTLEPTSTETPEITREPVQRG